MVQEQGSISIERPINEVFAFLLDGMNNQLWRTSVLDSQRMPGKPNSYKQGMKGPTGRVDADYDITEIKPNELIVMQATAGMVRPTSSFALATASNATQVTFTLRFEGKGPARMMEPMVGPIFRNEIGMLANLKAHLEQVSLSTEPAASENKFLQVSNPKTVMTPPSGFSQGIQAGNMIFVAGQVGVDAQGKLPGDGAMEAQTRQTIANVAAVLAESGATLADVVSATVYVKDLADYKVFNQVWDECFGAHKPARATVRADMVMPALLVEIQAIAVLPPAN